MRKLCVMKEKKTEKRNRFFTESKSATQSKKSINSSQKRLFLFHHSTNNQDVRICHMLNAHVISH